MTEQVPKVEKVVTVKQKPPICVNCKKRHAEGIYDIYARWWCEDCVIFILGDMQPRKGRW